jgi:hypothetical protein
MRAPNPPYDSTMVGKTGVRSPCEIDGVSRRGMGYRLTGKIETVVLTVFAAPYPLICEPMGTCTRAANAASATRSRTCGRLYFCDALLKRLAQNLQDMAAALRPFIQKENAVVRQRHFAGHRHLPATDQPDIRNGVVGSAKRPRRPAALLAGRWRRSWHTLTWRDDESAAGRFGGDSGGAARVVAPKRLLFFLSVGGRDTRGASDDAPCRAAGAPRPRLPRRGTRCHARHHPGV